MPIDDEQQVPPADDVAPETGAEAGAVTPGDDTSTHEDTAPPDPSVDGTPDAVVVEATDIAPDPVAGEADAPYEAPEPDTSYLGRGSQPAEDDPSSADAPETPLETRTVEDVMESGPAEIVASEHLVAVIEALVFASPEPIAQKQIFKLLDSDPKEDVLAAIRELEARYEARGGGLQLVQVAGGYQIVTRPELADTVRRMFHERTTQKLSIAALETLAVIAYKQPITAAEITEIRSVNTSGVVGTLLERGLIKISGRKQVVGRPFLYSTTREFLDRFGLKDLTDLPRVEDMAGALGFEVPAGLQSEAVDTLPLIDEPASEEDAAVLSGVVDEQELPGEETDGE